MSNETKEEEGPGAPVAAPVATPISTPVTTAVVTINKEKVEVEDPNKKKYRQKFRKEWLRREPFIGWLREVPGDCTKANCRLCKCTIAAKYYDIVKHSETKKHVNAATITNSMAFLDDDDDEYSELCLSSQKSGRRSSSGVQTPKKGWVSMLQSSSAEKSSEKSGEKSDKKDWVSILRPSTRTPKSVSTELVSILQRASGVQPKRGASCPSKFKTSPRKRRLEYEENDDELTLSYMELPKAEDEYDKVGAAWACELRKMDPEQQVFAKKAINDVLFEGRLGTLNRNSGNVFSPAPTMPKYTFSYTDTAPPPHGNISPPPSGNYPPPPGNYPPSYCYVSPPHGYVPPPHSNVHHPHGNDPSSHGNVHHPHGNDPPPHGNVHHPHGNDPSLHGNVPSPQGNVPSPHGNVPSPQGNIPSSHGNIPSPHGYAPPPHGNVPSPSWQQYSSPYDQRVNWLKQES